jgi:hypothetical protein
VDAEVTQRILVAPFWEEPVHHFQNLVVEAMLAD